MSTQKQKAAARENIKKAQMVWQSMSPRERAQAQLDGSERTKPGRGGQGEYYHVGIREKNKFVLFRTHDVGEEGHIERVAGKRSNGNWDTVKWLIPKQEAHIENGKLQGDSDKVKKVLEKLQGPIKHVEGDFFKANPPKNILESEKPTPAQKRARKENIKKAQEAKKNK